MDRVNTDYYKCYIRKRVFNNGYYGSENKDLPLGKVFRVIDVKKIDRHVYVRLSNNHWYPVRNLQCTTTRECLASTCLKVHEALKEGNTSIIAIAPNYHAVKAYLHELQVFFTSCEVPFKINYAQSVINVGYARIRFIRADDRGYSYKGLSCQVIIDPNLHLSREKHDYLLRHQNK